MRKKLFAVIMSIMMMVTFMPAMAFAWDGGSVSPDKFTQSTYTGYDSDYPYVPLNVAFLDNYTKARADIYKVSYDGSTYTFEKKGSVTESLVKDYPKFVTSGYKNDDLNNDANYYKNNNLNGSWEVCFNFNNVGKNNQDIAGASYKFSADPMVISGYYYDLSKMRIVNSDFDVVKELALKDYVDMQNGAKYPNVAKENNEIYWNLTGSYSNYVSPLGNVVQFYNGKDAVSIPATNINNYSVEGLELKVFDTEYEKFVDGSYTFNVKARDTEGEYSYNRVYTINSVDYNITQYGDFVGVANPTAFTQSLEIKTGDMTPDVTDCKWRLAGKKALWDANGNLTTTYNGKDQELTLDVKGFKAEYLGETAEGSTWSEKAPEIKNVGTYDVKVRFIKDGQTTASVAKLLTVKVGAQVAHFGFTKPYYNVRGTSIDVKDKFTLVDNSGEVVLADEDKAVFDSIASKYATFTEDKEGLVESYEVKVEIDKEALFADKEESVKQLLKNYDLENASDKTSVEVYYDDYIIDNVTAVNQTKTYHIKNAGKLKSTKTFMLKGDQAEYGTITYVKKSGNSKIKVASNGKVTVKKGLKKATYTVKIKVKAAGASEIKTLKVKIKK